jgi:cytochrome c oxidase subunit 2
MESKLIILIVIVLGAIAVAQLVRIYELSSKLRKRGEHEISTRDNNLNGKMMYAFMFLLYAFFIWLMVEYGWTGRGDAASTIGKETDWLLNLNFVIIIAVFFLTNTLLFYFSYKYVRKEGVKAFYFPHNNKLELIWTVIPAVVLTGLIAYGLTVWNDVIYPGDKEATVIELYSKQFDWTARYAGKDNTLGRSDFRTIGEGNDLGLIEDSKSDDDIIVKGEFHLVKDEPVQFLFRSRDVIHSAYMPHFRAQMNCVPGMETMFEFTPTITTAEMREKLNNPEFNYVLLCNKICGAAHYNMQMDIIVESKEDYNKWLKEQKTWAQTKAAATQTAQKNLESTATATLDK